jgi:hypothetical protein
MIERQATLQINTSIHSFVLEDCIMNYVFQMTSRSSSKQKSPRKFVKLQNCLWISPSAVPGLDLIDGVYLALLGVVSHHSGSAPN